MSCLLPFSSGLSPAEGRQGASIPSQYPAHFYGGGEGDLCAHQGSIQVPPAPGLKNKLHLPGSFTMAVFLIGEQGVRGFLCCCTP